VWRHEFGEGAATKVSSKEATGISLQPQPADAISVDNRTVGETSSGNGQSPSLSRSSSPSDPNLSAWKLPEPWAFSGVFHLLSTGKLEADHPEHPDAFGKTGLEMAQSKPFSMMTKEEKKLMRDSKKRNQRFGKASCGPLQCDLDFDNTYESALGHPVDFTTSTGIFSGAIDYIWHNSKVYPSQILELPPQSISEFGPIPNSMYPSDHICLGADFHFF